MLTQQLFLIIDMTKRDLKARYIGTSLGVIWLLLQPLFLLLIYTIVFSKILNVRFDSSQDTSTFAFYLMTGLIAFNAISESFTRSATALTDNRNLLLNTPLKAWVLPIIPVFSSIVIELISVVLLIFFFYTMSDIFSAAIWLYPILLFVRLCFSLAGSYLISILSVFFKDIGQALPLFLMILLFSSPILYPLEIVPENYLAIFEWNPMSHLVESYRSVLLQSEIQWQTISLLLLISFGLLASSIYLFQKLINQARLVL